MRFATARRISVGSIGAWTSPSASIASAAMPAEVATSATSSPRSTWRRSRLPNSRRDDASSWPTRSSSIEHLALELVERLRAAGVARGLDQHAHVAERRAQLVRHRGEQLALVGELLLDLAGHLVDRDREDPHLAALAIALRAACRACRRRCRVAALIAIDQRPRQPPRDRAGDHRQPDEREHDVPPARVVPRVDADRDAGGERDREPAEHPAPHPRISHHGSHDRRSHRASTARAPRGSPRTSAAALVMAAVVPGGDADSDDGAPALPGATRRARARTPRSCPP